MSNPYNEYQNKPFEDQTTQRPFDNTPNRNDPLEITDKLSVEDIESAVNDYIEDYPEKLSISDIFVFKDTDYYVSIEEISTGRGAMELLVNPYNARIYSEYGPNMMWNEKYSMMNSNSGMMGNGYRRNSQFESQTSNSSAISKEEAINIADIYVKDVIGDDFSVTDDGHEFYGYYTLHINKGDETTGMLSVNSYTGDVWYHDWHGELEEVMSAHDE
ncbi:hypothetical protein [Acetoanaerobium noterae]|uniref:hypothetical protein n=1 Tax=Acetoanaerobium noterae TaxID=745369 RepID=UPI0028AABA48|nr:hypothetical protein [Acetoanaerobium noterae]